MRQLAYMIATYMPDDPFLRSYYKFFVKLISVSDERYQIQYVPGVPSSWGPKVRDIKTCN